MEKTKKALPLSYWEIQKRQRRVSIILFLLLLLYYIITIGLISGAILFSLGLFLSGFNLFASMFFLKYAAAVLLISVILTVVNFFQAIKSGVNYILTNLRGYSPDPEDRYHLSFLNAVEEMRISSGLSEIKAYVIPTLNINSLSLIGKDNIPAIAVTEGLLAEASRDELEAVVAHETAHILKGDTFLLTLICSIAAFYESLLESVEKERESYGRGSLARINRKETGNPLIYLAGMFSYLLIHFFVALISQNREFLADATAVELSRHPGALARIIYKAQIANSYLGDTTLFTPLFLVPPDSRDITETARDKLFNTHPPVQKRLKILTEMAHKTVQELIEEVRSQEELREKHRTAVKAEEEIDPEREKLISNLQDKARETMEKEKVWMVKNSQGKWEGPHTLGALLTLPSFTPALRVKNIRENLERRAREFPQVRFALYRQIKNQPISQELFNRCPVCQSELIESFYEGVKVKSCQVCNGKLVRMDDLEKIFARKELNYSNKLKEKAILYQEAFLEPGKKPLIVSFKKPLLCPECGLQLIVKPFSYHYLIPVYKCYHCRLIWFEPDELEILQILVEKQVKKT
jgi:Zn-dependent protease with chaperone function/Zn-finger nucleic acid-binding protein